MRDFQDSTLWRVSAFDRMRRDTGTSGYARLEGPSLLSTTLLSELHGLERRLHGHEPLQIMAACLRHREPALLYVQHEDLVWPVTLFPVHQVYHCPRELGASEPGRLEDLKLLEIEPPGVRPPGHWMHERVAQAEHYRPLVPLLWRVALHGPRATLLAEIGGTAAYRAIRSPEAEGLLAPGALGSAAERLRRASVPLREIAAWPGMNVDRASRLLNGLYLASCLITTRTHPAARSEPGLARRLLGLGRTRRG